jgi:hypothetical protein
VHKKTFNQLILKVLIKFDFRQSRVDWIRTSDPLHPMQMRYRAAPPPEPNPETS